MTSAVSQPDAMRMPTRGELVEQVLGRFESVKTRSSVLSSLSRPDLIDVGLWLTEPGKTVIDAWRQLNDALGKDEHDPAIARTNFYRYAEAFLDLYAQVRGEYAQRLARLSVDYATDANLRDMTRLARSRVTELIAEKLVTSDNVDDLVHDLPKLAAALADAERAQHNADKLELDRQNLEQRAAKAEAEIDKIRQAIECERKQVNQRLKSLQTKIDELSKVAQRGQSIPQTIFDDIRSELTELTSEVAA